MIFKRMVARGAVVVVVLAACCASLSAKPILSAGERIVFLGDSITEQRIYTRYVMDFFALRYPGAKFSFRNAGWSGDTAPGGLERLERDVLSLKPSVVSICFGMNDGGYVAFDKSRFETYMTGMTGLVTSLKKAGVKVVLLTPGCVDTDRTCGWVPVDHWKNYNNTLELFAKGIKELAEREKLPVYDLHSLMIDVQKRAKADNSAFTMISDGVHPEPPGQLIMAYALLKALGCDDQASGLEIDAKNDHISADRCKVEDLLTSDNVVSFVRTDDALPMYIDAEAAPILKYLPVSSEMNRYQLKVTNLKPGKWTLRVQGKEIGKYTSDDLAAGVDLSSAPGPWADVAKKVDDYAHTQEMFYFARWRYVSLDWVPEEAQKEQASLLKKLDQLVDQKEAARIKVTNERSWRWSLTFAP